MITLIQNTVSYHAANNNYTTTSTNKINCSLSCLFRFLSETTKNIWRSLNSKMSGLNMRLKGTRKERGICRKFRSWRRKNLGQYVKYIFFLLFILFSYFYLVFFFFICNVYKYSCRVEIIHFYYYKLKKSMKTF